MVLYKYFSEVYFKVVIFFFSVFFGFFVVVVVFVLKYCKENTKEPKGIISGKHKNICSTLIAIGQDGKGSDSLRHSINS